MDTKIHKILVVDDSSYFRSLKQSYLKRNTCRVLQAKNGEEALYKISTEHPDLIIMDLSMPFINGEECCSMLKNHDDFGKIPIIMVANAWEKEAKTRCTNAGCDDFLLKPLDRGHLYAMMRRYLDISERRHTRVFYETKVSVKCGKIEYGGIVSNISKDGIFVKCSDQYDAGTRVELQFKLKGLNTPACVNGQVVWTACDRPDNISDLEPGMGIQFIDLPEETKNAIVAMIGFKPDLKNRATRPV